MVGVLLMAAAMTFAGNDVREGWEFRRGTTGVWSRVRIPHDATEEIRPRQSANLGDHGYVEGGVFQYRKAMPTPSGLPSGTRLSLHFDGVYFDSAVSVNGCHAGGRRSGYLPFEVELDPSRPTNVVEVTVDDRTPNTRWNPGAGILRSVSLKARRGFTLEPENVFVRVISADEARAEIAVSVDDAELLVPAGGRIVIEKPHLWSPEDPHLQDIRIVARGRNGEEDELVLPYGIRTVSFTKDRGMILNGRRYPIHGVCQHEGEPCFGAKLDVAALEYGMREMKKLGVNAIRTAHHPFPPEFYDLCDRIGFLVMDELFDQWREPKTTYGQSEFFEAEWRKDVETAVRRDRNHPSVVLWSIGNEIPELGACQYGDRHGHGGAKTALEMRNLIRTLDPMRPITAGLNGPKWAEDNGILPALDVCGLNYNPEFYDLFRGKHALVGSETAATYSLRDVYCYWTNDAELVIASHDGNLAGAHSMIPVWGVPEQGQEATLKRQMSAPWSAGEFTWCSFDYLGEGSNPLSKGTDHWPAVGSSWGMYDFAGLPKDRAYLYSAMWTDGPMAHLLPDWTLPGCEGRKVPVWCYTNCEEAELFLNGVSQGVRRRADTTDLHLAWTVAYAPGVLRVEARRGGKTLATDERRTAGRTASIRKTVLFERGDEILVRYDAVDCEGNRVIACEDEIGLDGSFGELLAAANGSPLETTARRATRRRLFGGSLAAWYRRRSAVRGASSGGVLRMMNVAHRGLWREANLPQNTVEAIKAAYDAGATAVETDFVETESGELICIHDIKALKSMSSVVIEPRKITPADRARINLGEKMGLPQPYRIPLLEDVLAVVPKDRVLQAEIKAYGPHYAVRFDAAVREAGLSESNVVVSSFRYEALKDFHAKFPKYRTLWLGCGIEKPADLDGAIVRAKAAGFDAFCPGCEAARKAGLVPADADKVRASGLDFRVFGVNSKASLEYAVSLRASGFTCDTFKMAYRWAAELKGVELQPEIGDEGTVKSVDMLLGENWWGLDNNFGREMPFTARTKLEFDLRKDNYAHQAQSVLVSDKGRAIWCPEPVGVSFADGRMRLASDGADITLVEKAGEDLASSYRYASRNWFPPTGEEPDLLYFSAPQYNTWIELTYHQNEKDILAYAQSMLDHGMPPGIFMIDDTWQHGYGTWEFDARRFSDPAGMMAKLHAMGYKVLLWMCPFVSMDTPEFRRIQFGKNPDDVRGWPVKGGFLASSAQPDWNGVPPAACVNWWNGFSALLDFTHPNAVAWFTEQLDRLRRDYRVDGFKFDGGGVHFYAGTVGMEGRSPRTFAHDRTKSPAAQSALYGEFALKYRGSEYRNAFGFGGKPVIMRLHDKAHTWDALGRLIPDMLAAGFVGCPFICPDMVGGGEWSTFIPGAPFSQELFIRSAQVQALCPMMQISASPWRYLDADHQRIFADVVRLRQGFAPKFVELARESAKSGEPIMRNLEYVFPGRGYADVKDEFMMGETLLVAPQTAKGATTRSVILPPGAWQADDGQEYDGGRTIVVSTPLARLPFFIRVKAK